MERLATLDGLATLQSKLQHAWHLHRYHSVKRPVMCRVENAAFLLRRYTRIHSQPSSCGIEEIFPLDLEARG